MHHLGDLTDSVIDFMATAITSTNFILLSWNPPATLVPVSYKITHQCRRFCELLPGPTGIVSQITLLYYSTSISPYTQCFFNLTGNYGAETALLTTNYIVNTDFNG